jgi:DNA-binding Xre family transcriptional regulator
MVDINELKACMARKGYTIQSLANEMDVTSRTLSTWMKNGTFRMDKVEQICHILDIKKPAAVFFAKK